MVVAVSPALSVADDVAYQAEGVVGIGGDGVGAPDFGVKVAFILFFLQKIV